MGMLKSIARSFMGTVFTLSLMAMLIAQNMVVFTSYDSLKPIFSQIASGLAPKELQNVSMTQGQLDQARNLLAAACAGRTSIDFGSIASQFGVDTRNLPVNLSSLNCANAEKILPANASSVNTASLVSGVMFDSLYYKNYSCDFIQCIMNAKSPTDYLVLISSTGNGFLSRSVSYLMIAAAASLVLFVLLTETMAGKIRGVGWSMLSVGVSPFVFKLLESAVLPMVLSRLPLPAEAQSSVSGIIDTLGSNLFNNFTIVFAIGVALLAVGYGLGFVMKKKEKKKFSD